MKKQIQMVADTLGKTLDCGKLLCDCRIRRSAGDRSGAEKKIADEESELQETRRLVLL